MAKKQRDETNPEKEEPTPEDETNPEKEEPTPAESETGKKSNSAEKGGICVYIGPSIHGVITTGAVFGKDKKTVLAEEKLLKPYPLVAGLIVSGGELSAARIKVKAPGNYLYENYKKLSASLTKEGEK